MNAISIKKRSKGLCIIVLFLLISVILNVILFKNIEIQEKKITQEQKIKQDNEEKNITILTLKDKITELENKINNSTNESKENVSNTEIEIQQSYLKIANEFIITYLNYNTKTLTERRKNLISIATDELVNQLAPEESENVKEQLSSDPTFSSKILNSNFYISGLNEEENESEIIADISYLATSREGESKVRTFISMKLKTMEDGTIKVINYSYYPIN